MKLWCLPLVFLFLFPASGHVARSPKLPTRATSYNGIHQIDLHLRPLLSPKATIVHNASAAPRWSDFNHQPRPGTVVNVATEHDVLLTVQYCNAYNIPFFAQAGGNAWAETFHLDRNGITINLRGINNIRFNSELSEITFQGGTIIEEVVNAAYAVGARVPTGNCNCVGILGAVLGGGVGRLMGLYGLGVDNLLSVNLVTAAGIAMHVNPYNDPDLWWALRGAGANFGIVTSATMKSYPVPNAENGAWLGTLIYTDDKIEQLVEAVNNMELRAEMAAFLYYGTTGAPDYTPVVLFSPYYVGTADTGKSAFSKFYDIGPIADNTAWTPYNETNAGSNSFCMKGGRKPTYGAGLSQMVPSTWRSIWNEFVKFLKNPDTGSSIVLLEAYSMHKARSIPLSSASYPFRESINFQAAVLPWYSDSSLDTKAVAFASKVRDLWRSTDGLDHNSTYINFASNDPVDTVYGTSSQRLQWLKKVHDPFGRLSQFFPL